MQKIESLKRINAYAESKSITLCLENLGWSEVAQSFEDLLKIRNEVGESLQFTLDIGHARLNSEGGVEEGFRGCSIPRSSWSIARTDDFFG
jgi:sugar phosphate isomerase/epimerase